MSFAQEIKVKCSELVEVTDIDIEPIPDHGFNVSIYFTHKDKKLRLDWYLAGDVWDDSGEIGVAQMAHNLLKSELEYYDSVH